MKKALKWLGIVVATLLLIGGSGYAWASWKTSELLSRKVETHRVDFPVPFPLTEREIEELRRQRAAEAEGEDASAETEDDEATAETEGDGPEAEGEEEDAEAPPDPLADVDLAAIARARAIERGRHLVEARYACIECHGKDFGGGVMVDDPMLGRLLGPNITGGKGGKTKDYTVADWDRIVRHGLRPDGRPSAMPAEDFQRMSDRELSDIIAYIRSRPNVDAEVEPVSFGPLGTVLMATGEMPIAADLIADHRAPHEEHPPPTEPTPEFGEHLAGVCTGCHRENLAGGPIVNGDPSWLPAANITPHEDGLAGWTYDDFVSAMRDMERPDGSKVREPMTLMAPYAANMTDVELRALWAYLQSLDPQPTGK